MWHKSLEILIAAGVVLGGVKATLWWMNFDPYTPPADFEPGPFWRKRLRVQARRRRLREGKA